MITTTIVFGRVIQPPVSNALLKPCNKPWTKANFLLT